MPPSSLFVTSGQPRRAQRGRGPNTTSTGGPVDIVLLSTVYHPGGSPETPGARWMTHLFLPGTPAPEWQLPPPTAFLKERPVRHWYAMLFDLKRPHHLSLFIKTRRLLSIGGNKRPSLSLSGVLLLLLSNLTPCCRAPNLLPAH